MSRTKITLASFLVIASTIIIYINLNTTANYIWKAYFYPGSNSILRGYPVISEPNNFTGTWTHYAYTGRVLARQEYVNGMGHGKGEFFDDEGNIYFARVLENGHWKSSGESRGVPETVVIPWLFPQRWINRSLNRLKIFDEIFKPIPAADSGEALNEKSHDKSSKETQ